MSALWTPVIPTSQVISAVNAQPPLKAAIFQQTSSQPAIKAVGTKGEEKQPDNESNE
jgi:hypothetical protein